ncbi:DUF5665 domain-containing protein [Paenibacillus typhae]|uniref:Uncharacterized protein n=1 Tax=Paenibacillus typhae TaxID=1174501 RepID=A0A1G8V2S1_9BACL|nr:hypothetical protein SAMN05216192_1202 [Paenibacillus typhae]
MADRHEENGQKVQGGRITVRTSGDGGGPSGQNWQETGREHIGEVQLQGQDQPISQEEKLNAVYRLTTGLAQQMEKARIAEYTELLHSPFRLIWLNILSGTARGVGIALGFTFFAATIIYVLQVLGALNLPIIGDYIADIVRIVQHQLELKTF